MKSQRIIGWLCLIALLLAPASAWAQAEQTPEQLVDEPLEHAEEAAAARQETEEESGEPVDSGETDFNEDNFRRSMELRDQMLQRSPDLTTGSYSRATGLQLEELPEESQKHLRNELREVIVGKGPWTPEESGEIYPYQPSEGAEQNPGLEKRERAAWAELVDKYHEREAAIHANMARTQAATASGMPQEMAGEMAGEMPGEAPGEMNGGMPGSEGQQMSQQSAGQGGSDTASQQKSGDSLSAASEAARNAAQNAANNSGSPGQAAAQPLVQGVSQNALELLTQRQQIPTGGTSQGQQQMSAQAGSERSSLSGSPSANQSAAQSAAQTAAQTAGQAMSQATSQETGQGAESQSQQTMAESASQQSQQEQSATQTAQSESQSQEGAESETDQAETVYRSEGVIAIEDLRNLDLGSAPAPAAGSVPANASDEGPEDP